MTRKNFGRNDLLLILGIFAAAVLMLAAYTRYMSRAGTPILEITVDNRLYGTYDLKHDDVIKINGTNVCEIKDGAVRMISADCPDQVCVHSVPITANGGSIVCLPNRVVLKIVNARDSESSSDSRNTGAYSSGSSSEQQPDSTDTSPGQESDDTDTSSGQDRQDTGTFSDSASSVPKIDTLAE